jgi:hypothetical protein
MSITTLLKVTLGGSMAVILGGCLAFTPYPSGSLYTGTQIPHYSNRQETSGAGKSGDKKGEACATGILGAAAFGDASLDAAKKAGGITDVHSVELHTTAILGPLYHIACTEVHGK